MKFSTSSGFQGQVTVPGDKSISHRSVMLGSIAQGTTKIQNFLQGADCLSTISCFRQMGIEINNDPVSGTVLVHGRGLHGLKKPDSVLNCGNSGTTTRLISGILSAQPFSVTLTGDESIQKRPMRRVIDPLTQMGANIRSLHNNDCAPLVIDEASLKGIHYNSPVASAQVKSAILLAGLYAQGETQITEPYLSRNHTELMLSNFGAKINTCFHDDLRATATIQPAEDLFAQEVLVPGDISSAAFFIAAGLIVPNSEILIRNVGINPTRDGILRICRAMGGDVSLLNIQNQGEATADLLIRSSSLHGTEIGGSIIPALIDELPIIAAMACFADGTTTIRDASELKVKESNRIEVMVKNLTAMGADVAETKDGMIIHGGKPLHGAVIDSRLDHRIAMTFAIAGCAASGETEILGADCVKISYPSFYEDLARLSR